MYNLSGELTVILITIWWLQKLGKIGSKEKSSTEVSRGKIYPQEAGG